MSDLLDEGAPSARHLLQRFLTVAKVPQEERQHYIDQADEVRKTHGEPYFTKWLQAWVDDYEATATFIATRMRDRMDAAYIQMQQELAPPPTEE